MGFYLFIFMGLLYLKGNLTSNIFQQKIGKRIILLTLITSKPKECVYLWPALKSPWGFLRD